MLDERIKKLMKEANAKFPWYGLMSSLSTYIKDGSTVKIQGTTNQITADEIRLLSNEVVDEEKKEEK